MKRIMLFMTIVLATAIMVYAQSTEQTYATYNEYVIVSGKNVMELGRAVKSRLKEGWSPVGGAFFAEEWYSQAMIK